MDKQLIRKVEFLAAEDIETLQGKINDFILHVNAIDIKLDVKEIKGNLFFLAMVMYRE